MELKLLNYDLEEILDDGILKILVDRVHQLWNTGYHYVTKVNYADSRLHRVKRYKGIARCKRVSVLTKLFNFIVNVSSAKKYIHYIQVLVLTELLTEQARPSVMFHVLYKRDN